MQRVPVDSHPYQEQSFEIGDRRIRLTLRFNAIGEFWAIDVFDEAAQQHVAQGLALVVGVPVLWRSTVPYFFWVTDESGADLDPARLDDMGLRCLVYVGLKSEVL